MAVEVPVRRAIGLLLVSACVALAAGCGEGAGEGSGGARLEEGWRAYSTGDFDVAVSVFEGVAAAPEATAEDQYSALLGLATTHHLRTNPDFPRARESYERLGELETPDALRQSTLGLALVDLAEGTAGLEGRTNEGQARLMALLRDFPDDPIADEAVIHLAASLLEPMPDKAAPAGFSLPPSGREERGANVLEQRLQTDPDNRLAPSMHIMLANHYKSIGQMREAVDHLIIAEKKGIAGVKTRSVVLWQIARIAENELKDYDLAATYYERYAREFKRTTLFYRARESLERVRALKAQEGA